MFGYLDDLKDILRVTIIICALSGCATTQEMGKEIQAKPNTYIDKEVMPYVKSFESHASKYMYHGFTVGHIVIKIVDKKEVHRIAKKNTSVGVCRRYYREVYLSRQFWQNATDIEKEMLVFHELGHCVLLRGHRDDNDSWGHPNSVMRWKVFDSWIYETNRDYYIEELFLEYLTGKEKE